MRRFLILLLVIFSSVNFLNAFTINASGDSIEVYLLDSFVTPEEPHRFKLSFITSDDSKSKVLINGNYEYVVSDEYTSSHNFELELAGLKFSEESVPFIIFTEDESGIVFSSDKYTFILPGEFVFEKTPNLFVMCLGGGIVAALPAPTLVYNDGVSRFSLSKELPLITYFLSGYNYPVAYFSFEYSYIFKAERKNFFRIGFKKIFETPFIEYISPGLTVTTDFNGYQAFSPELTLGLFKMLNVFTIYARYRFNYQLKSSSRISFTEMINDGTTYFFNPTESNNNFQEISIGLFYSFFTKQIRM